MLLRAPDSLGFGEFRKKPTIVLASTSTGPV